MGNKIIIEETVQELTERFKYSSDSTKITHILSMFNEIDRKVKYLNSGGCAVVAYSIVEYAKLLGIDAKVQYLFNDWSQSDYHRLQNNENGSCSHAVVVINNKMYDSNGLFDLEDSFGSTDNVTALNLEQDRVLESISYPRHWNPTYDRRDGRKKIQDVLKIPIKITKYSLSVRAS